MSILQSSVTTGPSGPVIVLAGEADLTTAAELNQLLAAQLDGATTMTIDLSGLKFADSATVRELIRAHRALAQRGGTLVLGSPQPAVAKVLSLLGVDHILTVRHQARTRGQEPADGDRGLPAHTGGLPWLIPGSVSPGTCRTAGRCAQGGEP